MTTKDNVIGAVLAGGRGRRIGADKASLTLNGRSLASYPAAVLESAGLEVVLALREGQARPEGLEDTPAVYDLVHDAGPIGGLQALLRWLPVEWALVVSCDQPFVRVDLLHGLLAHLEGDADAVVARTADRIQPLPGLFRKTCLPFVEEALAKGEMGLRDLLHHIRLCELEGEEIDRLDLDRSSFININTPEDLANARRLVAAL